MAKEKKMKILKRVKNGKFGKKKGITQVFLNSLAAAVFLPFLKLNKYVVFCSKEKLFGRVIDWCIVNE